jgi:hypothetical protein
MRNTDIFKRAMEPALVFPVYRGGKIKDIVPLITRLWILHRFAAQFQVTQPYTDGEQIDVFVNVNKPARASHIVSLAFQQPSDNLANYDLTA